MAFMPKSDGKWSGVQCLRTSRCGLITILLLAALCAASGARAQQSSATNAPAGTPEQIAALQLELTNAWSAVLKIVNQPVTAYSRKQGMHVSTYAPGWFHPGANTPDFNNVDIRASQDLSFASREYVTSDVTPGVVFLGKDLEFNPNTKLFYTNRNLPKHRLTDAQMQEINRLYRIIGRCRDEIDRLQTPAYVDKESTNTTEGEIIPGQSFEAIRKIPKETRMLYGGIGIGALVLLVVVIRLVRKRE